MPPTMPPAMAPVLEWSGLVVLALAVVVGDALEVSRGRGGVDSAVEGGGDFSVGRSLSPVEVAVGEDSEKPWLAATSHGTDSSEMSVAVGWHRNWDGGGSPGKRRVKQAGSVASMQKAVS